MKKYTSLIVSAAVSMLAAGCSKHGNQALYDYLGNPVAPPARLDAAFTKAGLTSAVQDAAQATNAPREVRQDNKVDANDPNTSHL